jgi:hypothetical protein
MRIRPLLSLLAVSLLVSATSGRSDSGPDPALDMLASGITLTDEAFAYSFANDGSFWCQPLDLSGPTLDGRWTIEGHCGESVIQVVAVAKCGWINGIGPTDSYRRIVFFIGAGETLPVKRTSTLSSTAPGKHYQCHWSIAEMKPTPEPPFAESQCWVVGEDALLDPPSPSRSR